MLALAHPLDLQALVEDELILALPLIPRHEACPRPLTPPPSAGADDPPGDNPFAALKGWRPDRGGRGHGH